MSASPVVRGSASGVAIGGEGWGSAGAADPRPAGTWVPTRFTALTADLQATTVGKTGITTREELRLDVPITNSSADGTKALAFLKLRQGQDRYKEYSLVGSDAVVGIRYHSSGFIGELSFQITQKNPLAKPSLPVPHAEVGRL